jgi:hypothetical protein
MRPRGCLRHDRVGGELELALDLRQIDRSAAGRRSSVERDERGHGGMDARDRAP